VNGDFSITRWGRVAAAIYLGVAGIAGVLAVQRLVISTEMPGLAAWELLVLAMPWTLILGTPLGRQADGLLLAAIALGGVTLNAGLLYAIAATLERRRRGATTPRESSGGMQHSPLSSETRRRLDALFTGAERDVAADLLLTQCGANIPLWTSTDPKGLERIRFAALKLSNGDLAELRRAVDIAQIDWRDALVAAGFGNDPHAHEHWFPKWDGTVDKIR
jgi:hypothetical protein